jgi:hypothetical protein
MLLMELCVFTSIRGLSDLLLKYPVPEGESQEILSMIYSEAVRMNELISETVGTGLGLPLVKEIVERHGGQVTLESEPDHGSVFTVYIYKTVGSGLVPARSDHGSLIKLQRHSTPCDNQSRVRACRATGRY